MSYAFFDRRYDSAGATFLIRCLTNTKQEVPDELLQTAKDHLSNLADREEGKELYEKELQKEGCLERARVRAGIPVKCNNVCRCVRVCVRLCVFAALCSLFVAVFF